MAIVNGYRVAPLASCVSTGLAPRTAALLRRRTGSRLLAVVSAVLLFFSGPVGEASAAWSVTAPGTSAARADVLAAPTALSITSVSCTPTTSPSTKTLTIAYRDVASATGSQSVTVARPAGTVAGDILVATGAIQNAQALQPTAAGWTAVGSSIHPTNLLTASTYYRFAASGDPTQWTFSSAAAGSATVAITAYSGVATANTVNAGAAGSGTGTTVTAPSISTTTAGTQLLGIFTHRSHAGISGPASMATRSTTTSGTAPAAVTLLVADEPFANTGPTGTRSATAATSAEWISGLIALAPATVPIDPTISFIGSAIAGGAPSLSLSSPAEVKAGDLLVVGYSKRTGTPATIDTPAGWTRLRTEAVAGQYQQALFWRVAPAAEAGGATYSFTSSDSQRAAAVLGVYRGVDQKVPVLADSGRATANTSNILAPSVTPGRTDSRLVGVFGIQGGESVTSSPPGMTYRRGGKTASTSTSPAVEQVGVYLFDEPRQPSTATGDRTAGSGPGNVVGQLIALKPESFASLDLSWTATTSTYADGYTLGLYYEGSPANSTALGAAAKSHSTGTLKPAGTYRIELRARRGNWTSATHAEVSVATSTLC